jgi:alkanesulfonate monooxygenase SsuD/methylene tetrahydromethanopterin reductase-like flavin-dependent oxidoreductase (luciferase family)
VTQLLARTRAPHVPHPSQHRTADAVAPVDRVVVDRSGRATAERAAAPHRRHGAEVVLAGAALDDVALLRSAAAADTVRLRYSPVLTSTTAVDALVAVLEGHLLAAGRRRGDVRVVLEVETVVADDEADAARRRANLSSAEAFSGLAWRPSSTWLVGTAERVRAQAAALVAATGVDAVELALVGRSREHAERLGVAVATAA